MNTMSIEIHRDSKGLYVEVSDGSKKHVFGNWREGDPCYKVANNVAELCSCSSVLRKVELVSYEMDT